MLIGTSALDRASGILAFAAPANAIAYLLVRVDCPGVALRSVRGEQPLKFGNCLQVGVTALRAPIGLMKFEFAPAAIRALVSSSAACGDALPVRMHTPA